MIRIGAATWEAAVSQSMPNEESHEESGADRFVAAVAEAKNPTSVMATWMAARNRSGSSESASAFCARREPSSASFCKTTRLALTSAISEPEKNPLTTMRTNVTRMDMPTSMEVASQPSYKMRLPGAAGHRRKSSTAKKWQMVPASTKTWKTVCMYGIFFRM